MEITGEVGVTPTGDTLTLLVMVVAGNGVTMDYTAVTVVVPEATVAAMVAVWVDTVAAMAAVWVDTVAATEATEEMAVVVVMVAAEEDMVAMEVTDMAETAMVETAMVDVDTVVVVDTLVVTTRAKSLTVANPKIQRSPRDVDAIWEQQDTVGTILVIMVQGMITMIITSKAHGVSDMTISVMIGLTGIITRIRSVI